MRGNPNDTLIPQSRDGFEGMTYHEAAYRFWDMCRRVRDAANVDIAYSTTSVLADLIDPTCSMDAIDTGEQADYECREQMLYGEAGWFDEEPPYTPHFKRCPECGCRVVSMTLYDRVVGDGR